MSGTRFFLSAVFVLLVSAVVFAQSFPLLIHGPVFDNATLYGRSKVRVNVTGNLSGFIYSGESYEISDDPYHPSGAAYSSGTNISYVAGELVTVESFDSHLTGYAGSASKVGESDVTEIRLYLRDIAPPKYYSVSSVPSFVRRGVSKVVYSSWMDNSGVVSLVVEHNGSGVLVNQTVFSNENVSSSRSVFDVGKQLTASINTSNFSRGTVVSWRLVGWDPSGNVNDSFPMQSFTVNNSLPVVDSVGITPLYPYANESLSCSSFASDLDGDNVTLYYRWLVNGVLLNQTGTGLGVGNFTQGKTVICRVTAYDGLENGTSKDGAVTIQSYGSIIFQHALAAGWNLISMPVSQ